MSWLNQLLDRVSSPGIQLGRYSQRMLKPRFTRKFIPSSGNGNDSFLEISTCEYHVYNESDRRPNCATMSRYSPWHCNHVIQKCWLHKARVFDAGSFRTPSTLMLHFTRHRLIIYCVALYCIISCYMLSSLLMFKNVTSHSLKIETQSEHEEKGGQRGKTWRIGPKRSSNFSS